MAKENTCVVILSHCSSSELEFPHSLDPLGNLELCGTCLLAMAFFFTSVSIFLDFLQWNRKQKGSLDVPLPLHFLLSESPLSWGLSSWPSTGQMGYFTTCSGLPEDTLGVQNARAPGLPTSRYGGTHSHLWWWRWAPSRRPLRGLSIPAPASFTPPCTHLGPALRPHASGSRASWFLLHGPRLLTLGSAAFPTLAPGSWSSALKSCPRGTSPSLGCEASIPGLCAGLGLRLLTQFFCAYSRL